MRSYPLWLVLAIVLASLVLGIGTTAALYATGSGNRSGPTATNLGMMGRYPAAPPSCAAPALPGAVVDVTLTDMGGMMGRGMMGPGWNGQGQNAYQWPRMGMMGMMRIFPNPATVPAGQVSFRALNTGWLNHELVVLPLARGQFPGQRVIGSDGKANEAGSLGEASRTCGADEGDEQSSNYGIAPGTTGWTTVTLPPGRYELICNIAGHYGAGMYAALDVTGPPR